MDSGTLIFYVYSRVGIRFIPRIYLNTRKIISLNIPFGSERVELDDGVSLTVCNSPGPGGESGSGV